MKILLLIVINIYLFIKIYFVLMKCLYFSEFIEREVDVFEFGVCEDTYI